MNRILQFISLLMVAGLAAGQGISKKLEHAIASLEADTQMKSGIVGFHVVAEKTGAVVFSRNGAVGMPVASSQKVVTSIATLALLGKDFRYQTLLGYNGDIVNGVLNGNLLLSGSGDPSLGSWRYQNTRDELVLKKWTNAVQGAGIARINGSIEIDNKDWKSQSIPGGWIWDDIGNYYGAGATKVNWHENQYDLRLQSGNRIGEPATILATDPLLFDVKLTNELTAARAGSGDNVYIYLPPYSSTGYLRGTIPIGQSSFTVSGSFPDPNKELIHLFEGELGRKGISILENTSAEIKGHFFTDTLLIHQSPPLDSLNYWFLRKSINLYGEAFAKTLGAVKKQDGSTAAGVEMIRKFWMERGVDSTSINIVDASGLSPQNRITPEALVKAMQYVRSQTYFNSFYDALPEFNAIKMKSGTIGGVKSFTGYVNGYIFAIVVNNFNGSAGEIVRKMYRILDLLK